MLPCRIGQTTQDYRRSNCAQAYIVTVYFSFSVMADDWNSRAADDQYCMRTSWDPSVDDKCVDLTSPVVVVLDTTVVPDVMGLCTFDVQAPVVRVLPGDFGNTVRVLVPDDRSEPRGFHDLLIENLSGTTGIRRGLQARVRK